MKLKQSIPWATVRNEVVMRAVRNIANERISEEVSREIDYLDGGENPYSLWELKALYKSVWTENL